MLINPVPENTLIKIPVFGLQYLDYNVCNTGLKL